MLRKSDCHPESGDLQQSDCGAMEGSSFRLKRKDEDCELPGVALEI